MNFIMRVCFYYLCIKYIGIDEFALIAFIFYALNLLVL
jgi:hypothetical protein